MAYKTFVNGFPLNASEINNNLMNQSVATFLDASARSTAISAPVQGQVTYLTSDSTYYSYDGAAWVEMIPTPEAPASSPNYIINGAFDVWQRGTSFTSGSNVYTADRWQYQASGATSTITQETFTPADLEINSFGDAKYYLGLEATVANDNAGIRHKIEDVRTLAGQTATLSFWAKSDATSLKAVLGQSFGSGGSSFNTVSTQTFTPTTSWVRYSFQYDITSVSGKTIGDGSALEVEISNVNNELFTMDIWGVQLEAGIVATPFKRNSNSLQGELAACQRYYITTDSTPSATMIYGGTSSAGFSPNAYHNFRFPVEMRATPTITFYAHDGTAGAVSLYVSGSPIKSTSVASIGPSPWGWSGNFAGNSPTWSTNADSGMLAFGFKAEAEL